MTREEAIAELKTRYFSMSQCLQVEELHKANEAIDLAIEALQMEPCDDYISRQRALDIVEFNRNSYDGNDAVVWIEREIKELPSVQPEQITGKWEYLCYQNMKCSKCGYVIAEEDNVEFRFCPNCGCRMEEGE